MAKSYSVAYLVSHLQRYRKFGVYPDGSYSMLKQAVGFLRAAQIYDYFMQKYEADYIKNGYSS